MSDETIETPIVRHAKLYALAHCRSERTEKAMVGVLNTLCDIMAEAFVAGFAAGIEFANKTISGDQPDQKHDRAKEHSL